MPEKTALVLSAGGMFGAYQAGVWKALAGRLRPDMVVGASVGALNAWLIAGGAAPEELIAAWLDGRAAALARVRLAQPPWRGLLDARALYAEIQKMLAEYRPQVEVGIVAVEVPRLRLRLFRNQEIAWQHLAASCALLLCYPPVRIGGRLYTDGGLLETLPLWAAAELGATRAVAVNALPWMPSRLVRSAVGAFRRVAPKPPAAGGALEVMLVAPSRPLGSVRESLFWERGRVAEWIAQGEADAAGLRGRLAAWDEAGARRPPQAEAGPTMP